MLIFTTLLLTTVQIDLYPTPPGAVGVTIPYTLKLDVYGNARIPITGAEYVEFWGKRYAMYGDMTLRITGGEAYSTIQLIPEPMTGLLMGVGFLMMKGKRK